MFDSIANKFRLNATIAVLRFVAIAGISLALYFSHNISAHSIFMLPWMIAGLLLACIMLVLSFIKKDHDYLVQTVSVAQVLCDTLLFAVFYIGASQSGIYGTEIFFLVPIVYSILLLPRAVPAIIGWIISVGFIAGTALVADPSAINPLALSYGFVGTIATFLSEALKKERAELFKTKELVITLERQIGELKRAGDASDYLRGSAEQKLGALDEAKNEFITLLTHELRTPISAVRWILDTLKDAPDSAELVQKGIQSIDRVNVLIDRINRAGTDAPYVFKKENLSTIIGVLLQGFDAEVVQKKLTITVNMPENIPPIEIDAEKISTALGEIIENAITFTPDGGTIKIALDERELNSSRSAVLIRVEDSGIGIPKDEKEKIFNKFYRGSNAVKVDTDGTGLGLYVAEGIVGKHGGNIWFEDGKGGGTVFYIRLPVRHA